MVNNLIIKFIKIDYISYRPPEDPIHIARASTVVQKILKDIIKKVNTYKVQVPPITSRDLWPFSYTIDIVSKPASLQADDGMLDSNRASSLATSSSGNSESDSQYESIQRPTTPGSSRVSNRMSYFSKFG